MAITIIQSMMQVSYRGRWKPPVFLFLLGLAAILYHPLLLSSSPDAPNSATHEMHGSDDDHSMHRHDTAPPRGVRRTRARANGGMPRGQMPMKMPEDHDDHSMHDPTSSGTAGKHAGAMMDGEKRHGLMPLAPKHSPPRFWESDASQSMDAAGHQQPESGQHDHSMPKGMMHESTASTATGEQMIPEDSAQAMGETAMGHAQKHLDPTYVCPMHPEEVSDEPGSCSICGMFLMKAGTEGQDKEPEAMGGMQHAMPMQQGGSSEEAAQSMDETAMGHARKHLDSTYVCPMHPEEVSNDPGSCSICGMFLVAAGSEGKDKDKDPEAMDGMQHSMPMDDDEAVEKSSQAMDQTAIDHAQKHLDPTYVCPMHPQIVQDEPGNCPICGMDLVSRDRVAPASDNPQVFLPAAVIQNMGVRTARAEKRSMGTELRTQGIITADDDRIRTVHPRAGGWVETLYLLTEGDRIERKEVLIDFYSPWINQAQIEFIKALEAYDLISYDPSRKTELGAKVDAQRNALRLLKVSPMDIMRVENSRKVQSTIQLMAPNSGLVTELNVREGAYVEPYQPMFTIVDLSEVWVMVDIYEHQAPWVRKGNHVEITAPAIPGRTWNGMVDFIYPEVDPKTRTLRARIEVSNPDEALLLNMFVQVDLSASAKRHHVLTVPREAVIVTGEREVVVKALGKGHFQPVEVKSGIWSDGKVEILSGLEAGDEIVVSGQFLIDSESSLQASFLRMSK